MRFAVVTLGVAGLVVGMMFTPAEAKAVKSVAAKTSKSEQHSHAGAFVSTSAGKMVMTSHNGKEHTYPLAKDVKVMIDGKAGALAGLTKGMSISVTMDKTGNVTGVSTVAAKPTGTATPAKAPAPTVTPASATAASTAPAAATAAKPVK